MKKEDWHALAYAFLRVSAWVGMVILVGFVTCLLFDLFGGLVMFVLSVLFLLVMLVLEESGIGRS